MKQSALFATLFMFIHALNLSRSVCSISLALLFFVASFQPPFVYDFSMLAIRVCFCCMSFIINGQKSEPFAVAVAASNQRHVFSLALGLSVRLDCVYARAPTHVAGEAAIARSQHSIAVYQSRSSFSTPATAAENEFE